MNPILPFILLLIFAGSHSSQASVAVQNGYPSLLSGDQFALQVVFRSTQSDPESAPALGFKKPEPILSNKIAGQNEKPAHLWIGQSTRSRDGPFA